MTCMVRSAHKPLPAATQRQGVFWNLAFGQRSCYPASKLHDRHLRTSTHSAIADGKISSSQEPISPPSALIPTLPHSRPMTADELQQRHKRLLDAEATLR